MRFIALLLLLPLAACDNNMNPIDSKAFLASLEGPKVPSMKDTFIENAKNAENQGDYAQAAQFYQQALEKMPEDKDIMLSLAEAFRRSGSNDQAIMTYDAVLQKDDKNLAAKEGKSLSLMAKGDFETPANILSEVVKSDPTRWKTLNALGILFSTRSMQSEAQAYYLEALKYSPSNPAILNNLGLSQGLDRKFPEAIASLSQAAGFATMGSDDRKRIELNLSLVYAIAGKTDDARAIAERYFSGPTLNNNLGLYAHLANDDQLAKAYLNMALTESKTFYEKAWDNLQILNGKSPAQDSAQVVVKTEQPPVTPVPEKMPETKPKAKPKPKPKPKAKPAVKKEEPKAPQPQTEATKEVPLIGEEQAAEQPAPAVVEPAPAVPSKAEEDHEIDKIVGATGDKK